MARTRLLLAALALAGAASLAAPADAAAQEFTWTSERPDGIAPAGIALDRIIAQGTLEITPRFSRFDLEGIRFGDRFIAPTDVFGFDFTDAPLNLSTRRYGVDLAYGATDRLTFVLRAAYVEKDRQQIDQEQNFFELSSQDLADTEIHGLYEVVNGGAYRAHLSTGVSIPTGSVDKEGGAAGLRASGVLPYDMQTGSGVFGWIPGGAIQAMNEYGSVGIQVMGHVWFGENDRGWRPGASVEANGWAAYRMNDWFSVSSGLRARTWEPIEGFDEELNEFRDPGEVALSFGGERVGIPLGLNLYFPEGVLAGHRMGVEFLFNVHEDLDGPLLAADDGFSLIWTKTF